MEPSARADSVEEPAVSLQGSSDAERESPLSQQTAEFSAADNSPMVGGGSCFFADATLDLGEAHAIAETPEPKKTMVNTTGEGLMGVPSLQETPSLDTDSSSKQLTRRNLAASTTGDTTLKLNRLTNTDPETTSNLSFNNPTYRPRPPRRPRDIAWAMAFLLLIPVSLTQSLYPSPKNSVSHSDWLQAATANASRHAMTVCIFVAFVATQVLNRLLYRTMGGGDGDDARHLASQVLLVFAPISVAIHPLLILAIYVRTPSAIGFAVVPLFFLIRDVWALRHWRAGGGQPSGSRDAVWHDQGRQSFFQALSCMALDILSRSLRRSSFYRMMCALLSFQFVVVWLWRRVLLRALAIPWGAKGLFFLCLALLGGKWATGTVTRILGLIASGGITSWFTEQSVMMEEMEQMQASAKDNTVHDDNKDAGTEGGDEYGAEDAAGRARARAAFHSLPEAYRATDASAYSVLDLDEGIDDDFEEEEEEGTFVGAGRMGSSPPSPQRTAGGSGLGGSNVKAFLFSALTVSFGSVAQCGLVGGLAQFAWSVIRNVDAAIAAFNQRSTASGRFQGMQIGTAAAARLDGNSILWKLLNDANTMTRSFVRNNTDLAMSHVAAYFKHYRRAANDVFVLVDTSGVEPIVHDDITTHMCACLCASISGIIVIVVGFVLSHHRQISASEHLSDKALVESMLLAFLLCYTLLFSVMEPLRASIKAVYICFAQHPQSLSQSFPLIFHRLTRISEATLV